MNVLEKITAKKLVFATGVYLGKILKLLNININIKCTILDSIIITEIVLKTPCLSIQFAINPGIIFPITTKSMLKKLFCSVEINPSRKEIVVGDFEINDKDDKSYNETTFVISSLQDLRKSINQLLINYEG